MKTYYISDLHFGHYNCLLCKGIVNNGYCLALNLTNCEIVSKFNPNQCEICSEEYYLTYNGEKCEKFSEHCRRCENKTGASHQDFKSRIYR